MGRQQVDEPRRTRQPPLRSRVAMPEPPQADTTVEQPHAEQGLVEEYVVEWQL